MASGILSPTHLLVVLVVALIVLGPKRLPGAGRALGQGLREFKDSISGVALDSHQGQLPSAASLLGGSDVSMMQMPARETPGVSHDSAPVATAVSHDSASVAPAVAHDIAPLAPVETA
jgi:sec-independent protein translocase protein TatA